MFDTKKAFTMVEMAVVVTMIGILAVLVVPRLASAEEDSRIAAAAEDLQRISQAFEYYRSNHGYWPPDTAVGRMPPEMRPVFKNGDPFEKLCPIGGVYDYENVRSQKHISIRIRSTMQVQAPQMVDAQALDEYLDDGVLNTGKFRSTSGGGYTYSFAKR